MPDLLSALPIPLAEQIAEVERTHDPGGKVARRLPPSVTSAAQFSECGRYRYLLTRQWRNGSAAVMWVMMNPSTATAELDDPTLAKCRAFTARWGYSRMVVANVMAYRATHPADLLAVDEPVGARNYMVVREVLETENPLIVCGWGKLLPKLRGYGDLMEGWLRECGATLNYLRLNGDGSPAHPLYLHGTLRPTIWRP